MSRENLEIVRSVFDLFGTGEGSEHWSEDVVVTPPQGWPEGGEVRGLDAWMRQVERLRDSWQDAHVEIDEMHPVGEERVVTTFRYVTTGKDSGLSFETPMGAIHTIKDRSIVRADFFRSPEDALKAAGLSD